MKMIGIIIYLMQIGSYVPADYAKLPIIDKMFTRLYNQDHVKESYFLQEAKKVAISLN
jgi:DNA mismatch repair protein MutS